MTTIMRLRGIKFSNPDLPYLVPAYRDNLLALWRFGSAQGNTGAVIEAAAGLGNLSALSAMVYDDYDVNISGTKKYSSFIPIPSAFTMMFLASFDTSNGVFVFGSDGTGVNSANDNMRMQITPVGVAMATCVGGVVSNIIDSTWTIPQNTIHAWAVRLNGTAVTIDNLTLSLRKTGTLTNALATSFCFYIGGTIRDTNAAYTGKLIEAALYNAALTDENLLKQYAYSQAYMAIKGVTI